MSAVAPSARGRSPAAFVVKVAPVVVTLVVAAADIVADRQTAVVTFGILAVGAALIVSLQRQPTLLPSVPVLLLVFQYLAVLSGSGIAASIGWMAGEAALLWVAHGAFTLGEELSSETAVRPKLLVRWSVRVGTTLVVSIPLAFVVAALGRAAPEVSWLRVVGPIAAVAVVCGVAAHRRRARGPVAGGEPPHS